MDDVDRLTALIEPALEEAGAELVELEVAGTRNRPVLRAYVDREGGITLDDCARLSRRLEHALESAGAVPERYVLEVSSPGIERRLSRRRDFERQAGRDISVRLYTKREGRKRFIGRLERVLDREEGSFAILVADPEGGGAWTFEKDDIAAARLHVSW